MKRPAKPGVCVQCGLKLRLSLIHPDSPRPRRREGASLALVRVFFDRFVILALPLLLVPSVGIYSRQRRQIHALPAAIPACRRSGFNREWPEYGYGLSTHRPAPSPTGRGLG